ncbi:MAG: nicotinate-nucleotide adenylyltransferase [Candidatus Brocadiales bacterium]|nr:nicotinate-nucleotide adenylyltransferase [Candidatus Bathyanammoxibius amoris]
MRIGILGGTFNPVHIGHLIIAEEVYHRHGLDRVQFIPSGQPPHKNADDIVDARHRYEMVALAIKDTDHFDVSDVEISREGKSYTIDTVEAHPELYGRDSDPHLIIGTDTVNELPTWKEIKRLAELCRIVVVNRPGNTLDNLNQLVPILGREKVEEIRRIQVEIPPVDISSTEIRRRLRSGLPISHMVPQNVELYIKKHGLYR